MQKGFTTVLVLVGILVLIAVAGGAYYFGKSQTPKSQNQVVVSQTPQPTPVQCQTCAGSWDTTCPGNFTCVVPDGYSQGVCRPVPKIGHKYTIDQINNACGTNFSDKTTKN